MTIAASGNCGTTKKKDTWTSKVGQKTWSNSQHLWMIAVQLIDGVYLVQRRRSAECRSESLSSFEVLEDVGFMELQ